MVYRDREWKYNTNQHYIRVAEDEKLSFRLYTADDILLSLNMSHYKETDWEGKKIIERYFTYLPPQSEHHLH